MELPVSCFQIGPKSHVPREYLGWTMYINHSCDPNVAFVVPNVPPESGKTHENGVSNGVNGHPSKYSGINPSVMYVESVKDLHPEEELGFNYCTTEHTSPTPFYCKCGSPKCYLHYRGYSFLTEAQKEDMRHLLSPYLRSLLDADK